MEPGTNPELAHAGAAAQAQQAIESPFVLPPLGPRMRPLHGDAREPLEEGASWRTDDRGMLVGDRVTRFRDPDAADVALPNPALVRPLAEQGPGAGTVLPSPRFSTIDLGDRPADPDDASSGIRTYHIVSIDCDLEATSLYGTGEQPGHLLRNGATVACWNSDRAGYEITVEGLYQSHPWVLGLRADGSAFGIMAETTHCCEIDLTAGITFRSLGPSPTVLVIERDDPASVVRALAELTGTMPLPPRWALGFQQSRWSYYPASRVMEVANTFRRERVPCDVLWIDIDYMNAFRVFTFDPERFPDPRQLNKDLAALGFHVVWMIDPGIKAADEDEVYREGVEQNHFIRTADDQQFLGRVWPGLCAFPDFLRRRTRDWWASRTKRFMHESGAHGIWNDMNEPAVFGPAGTTTMPFDVRHDADEDLGGPGSHERYHNLYGMQMVRATREGVLAAHPDRRPFVLTRSNFLGGQRYAATWTGDNKSDWTYLQWTIPSILNLGLSGQPFAGVDIGGFFDDADPDLFARWMGIGALLPFARAHSAADTKDHEPWSFGDKTLKTCRWAIERRMCLLPYLYTLFHEAASAGMPICRPIFFADPADPRLRSAEASFLLGSDVLVRAAVARNESRCHDPMPGGRWQAFDVVDAPHTAHLPELHLRAGSIVPVGPVCQHANDLADAPLTLMVALDDAGRAEGQLYDDAGDGHQWTRQDHALIHFVATRLDHDAIALTCRRISGTAPGPKTIDLILPDSVLTGRRSERVSIGTDASHAIAMLPPVDPD